MVMGETRFPKVMGSNPGAIYRMVITFLLNMYIYCKNCNVCLKRQK